MDRIDHPTAVDIGGGRRGFRSKDTVAGVPGTVATATHLNAQQEETVGLIEKAGLVPSGDRVDQMLRGIRRGKLNALTAGGTANALTVTLDPAPLAGEITVGTHLWIKITANNTGPATLSVNGTVDPLIDFRGAALAQGALTIDQMALVAFDGDAWRLAPQPGATAPLLSVFTNSTPGTRTVTPTTTGWYQVVLVGAGGGGGGGVGTGGGGGGAGGGVVTDYVYLIAGTAYPYTVGTGGALGGPGFNGSAGTSTSFVGPGGTIVATGGGAGGGAGAGVGGLGASGGTGSGQSALGEVTAGQPGFQGSPQINQSGQGGSSPGGGFGGQASFGGGNNGGAPGGGASGGTNGNNGGVGGNGRITLRALGV